MKTQMLFYFGVYMSLHQLAETGTTVAILTQVCHNKLMYV